VGSKGRGDHIKAPAAAITKTRKSRVREAKELRGKNRKGKIHGNPLRFHGKGELRQVRVTCLGAHLLQTRTRGILDWEAACHIKLLAKGEY